MTRCQDTSPSERLKNFARIPVLSGAIILFCLTQAGCICALGDAMAPTRPRIRATWTVTAEVANALDEQNEACTVVVVRIATPPSGPTTEEWLDAMALNGYPAGRPILAVLVDADNRAIEASTCSFVSKELSVTGVLEKTANPAIPSRGRRIVLESEAARIGLSDGTERREFTSRLTSCLAYESIQVIASAYATGKFKGGKYTGDGGH